MTGATFDKLTALESKLNIPVGDALQDQALRRGQREAFDKCMRIACSSNTSDARVKMAELQRVAQGKQRKALHDGYAIESRQQTGAVMAYMTIALMI